jgi:hypothetical protein
MTTYKSRRKEPFRYLFSNRTECTFQIMEINGSPVDANPAAAAILDISKSGCKLRTTLNLNVPTHRIKLVVRLVAGDQTISFGGSLRWQQHAEESYLYGVQLELLESEKNDMLLAIRQLAVNKQIEVP